MEPTRSILIIDDEANLRRSLSVILQRAGYSVTATACAQDAWLALAAGSFDLVLLDIKMPDANGLELLPQICAGYPDVAVVLITAHATIESAIEAVRKGARDYFLKPINPNLLLARVEEILTNKDHARRQREILEEMRSLLHEYERLGSSSQPNPGADPLYRISRSEERLLKCGLFTLDLHTRTAQVNGRGVSLSPTAFNYLVTLVRHSPQTVDYETLVTESQGYETTPVEAYEMARWRIHELRKTVEDDSRHPKYIITLRGTGYRLVGDPFNDL